MKHLNPKQYLWLILGPFCLSFSAFYAYYFYTQAIPPSAIDIFGMISKSVTVVALLGVLFVNYIWKWKLLRGWLVPFPDLNGTWQGTIQSTWVNPETSQGIGPIPAILTIKQSFIKMSCVMRTPEMVSYSYLADFWLDGNEQIRKLGYSYNSVPRITVRDRSKSHVGTVIFDIVGYEPAKLNGIYWSDRKSTGEIKLEFREKLLLEEFPDELGAHPLRASVSK